MTGYDFDRPEDRKKAWNHLKAEKPRFLLGSQYLQYSVEMPFGAPQRRQQEAMRTHLYLRDLPKAQSLTAARIVAKRGAMSRESH